MKQSDVDFLRNYAAGGGTVLVQNAQGQYVQANAAPDTVVLQRAAPTTPLNQNASNAPTQPGQTGQPGQPGGQPPMTPAQQRAQQRAAQQQQKAQRQAAQRGAALGVEAVGGRFAALGDRVNGWSERAAAVPTPGGIAAMVVTLAIIISAIVPVNQGYTRAQLFWMTFLNQTFIPEAQAAEATRESGLPGTANGGNALQGIANFDNGVLNTITGGNHFGTRATPGSSVSQPAFGQLPIAPPMPSTGIRGYGA